MNKKNIPVEFVYQLFALIIAIIIVHAFYVSVVRPNAAEVIAEQNLMAEADPDFVRERSVWYPYLKECEYCPRTRASLLGRCKPCRRIGRRCYCLVPC